jgi:CSLREA domain-containing protein
VETAPVYLQFQLACHNIKKLREVTKMKKYQRALIIFLLILVPLLVWAGLSVGLVSAHLPASIIMVNTMDDELNSDGDCSLREAIQAANTDSTADACVAGSGADTILIPAGTYTLTISGAAEDANATGDLDILDDLTLQGAGAISTTIDGNALDRVLHVLEATVEIHDVTITNGYCPNPSSGGGGGGIRNDNGTLAIFDSAVTFNISGAGGGLFNRGSNGNIAQMIVDNVEILGNLATDELGGVGAGGGIGNSALDEGSMAILTVTHSLVAENHSTGDAFTGGGGGGIFSIPAYCDTCGTMATITDSTIRDNAADYGGGIVNSRYQTTEELTASLILERCTISGNTASSLTAGAGGGIAAGGGNYHITNSTISNNHSIGTGLNWEGMGGGIFILGYWGIPIVNIQNTTIVSNTAASDGGGLSAYTSVGENPEIYFTNSVVSNNHAPTGKGCYNHNATFTSQGYNLEDGDSCNFDQLTDWINTDPLFGPLQDNGGPTWTHALLLGSPAIDQIPTGTNGCGTTLTTDQRGFIRPQDGDGDEQALCDIGAVERMARWLYLPLIFQVNE